MLPRFLFLFLQFKQSKFLDLSNRESLQSFLGETLRVLNFLYLTGVLASIV